MFGDIFAIDLETNMMEIISIIKLVVFFSLGKEIVPVEILQSVF